MVEIVLNIKYGGFGLSEKVLKHYMEKTGKKTVPELYLRPGHPAMVKFRCDPVLIQIIKEIGLEESAGKYCKLKIENIPDAADPECIAFTEYDGCEGAKVDIGKSILFEFRKFKKGEQKQEDFIEKVSHWYERHVQENKVLEEERIQMEERIQREEEKRSQSRETLEMEE